MTYLDETWLISKSPLPISPNSRLKASRSLHKYNQIYQIYTDVRDEIVFYKNIWKLGSHPTSTSNLIFLTSTCHGSWEESLQFDIFKENIWFQIISWNFWSLLSTTYISTKYNNTAYKYIYTQPMFKNISQEQNYLQCVKLYIMTISGRQENKWIRQLGRPRSPANRCRSCCLLIYTPI